MLVREKQKRTITVIRTTDGDSRRCVCVMRVQISRRPFVSRFVPASTATCRRPTVRKTSRDAIRPKPVSDRRLRGPWWRSNGSFSPRRNVIARTAL